MSARLCAACSRSRSRATRSRASWRFWSSKISGAAYEACSDKMSVKKMNGKGSKRSCGGASTTFQSSQRMITTVIPKRKRAVPMNRAKASANLPKASRSTLIVGMVDLRRRPGTSSRSASRTALAMRRHSRVRRLVGRHRVELDATPVLGQHVIKHIVDRDRADQPMISIDNGSVHQVVRREIAAHVVQVRLVGERFQVGVDQGRDQCRRRLPEQPLEVHRTNEATG